MKQTFTLFNSTLCILDEHRVDIWQIPLHTEHPKARTLLNEEESLRANRYYFAKHQRRFTVARATLRLILSRYLSLPPADLCFEYNEHGKPKLAMTTDLHFNLSHSGDLALLAVGKTHPLGIDLEFFSARPYEGIAKQLFSTHEIWMLSQLSLAQKPWGFFHIWSQKEAFIKACGLGLAYPTQDFDVSLSEHDVYEIKDTKHQQAWNMLTFMPQVACSAALCYHPSIEEIRYASECKYWVAK